MHKPTEKNRPQPLQLSILSPVFIGDGELLDPLRYVLRQQDHVWKLHYLDVDGWVRWHPEPERLLRDLDQNDFARVRKVLQVDARLGRVQWKVTSESLIEKYQEEMQAGEVQNQLQIASAIKNPLTGRLLIPGSSLKGAIRTAVIDFLDQKYQLSLKNERNFQLAVDKMMGGIQNHAFKRLKIGDFEARLHEGWIVGASENKLNPKKQPTPKPYCEVVFSELMGHADYSLFSTGMLGQFAKDYPVLEIEFKNQGRKVQETFDFQRLSQVTLQFYRKRFEEEHEKFYALDHFEKTRKALEPLRQRIDRMNPNSEMLLRIGHYSHIESMTLTNNSPQPRRDKSGNPLGPGTTRTLANGQFPFGWVVVSLVSEEAWQTHQRQLDQEWRQVVEQEEGERQEAENQLLSLRHAQEEAQRQKQQAEQQAKVEAERRGQMTELERLLEDVLNPQIDAKTLFGQLDQHEGQEQSQLAQAFQKRFQQDGEWEGKMSKKQVKKVQRIQDILKKI